GERKRPEPSERRRPLRWPEKQGFSCRRTYPPLGSLSSPTFHGNTMSFLHYWQLDVFADRPLAGNGLAVFADARGLADATLQALTQELRQFESIFLFPSAELDTYAARIFTPEEELPFAGHPLLGAAALLHHIHQRGEQEHW